jgi:hypothetical protein
LIQIVLDFHGKTSSSVNLKQRKELLSCFIFDIKYTVVLGF